ncbi:MAG: peroxiredoxin [Candidatus Gastranaerophilales bacterium]|nr:peroxiredoxin [Candidatus Gastranaerophilales bacterium]
MHYLDIELKGINENGEEQNYKLSDFKGKNLIVYFYPEDDSPVCTQEANDFKEKLEEIKKYAEVIGISRNNIEEHVEFKNKHKLNFKLLSDIEDKLKHAFSEHIEHNPEIHRSTFILDKDGKIVKYL